MAVGDVCCPLPVQAAAILNLTMDHMERHGSMQAYGAAKCNLFQFMGPHQTAILPSGE